jgi:NAD(P)-dependent dehydrogenase (short-subunit alcohol dehydrogenase family)
MNVNLHQKVALVTGAARGIGFAAAQLLAQNGARVVIADIDEEAATAAAAGIAGSKALRMDVSSPAEVESAVRRVVDDLGRIDILVNNAGINTNHRVTIDRFPIAEWDRVMAVDLRGVFLVSRAVSMVMVTQGTGRIINIASVAGLVPVRLQCAYTTAKAGVINLTRSMAIELASNGIAVNCIAPGSTLTVMTEVFYGKKGEMSEQAKKLVSHIPAGRAGKVEEIGQVVLFLSDPDSTYVTGQIISVDGGWTAGGFMRDF